MSSKSSTLGAEMPVGGSEEEHGSTESGDESLRFRDYSSLSEVADEPFETADSGDVEEADTEYDLSSLGKWFAAYLPSEHREAIRTTVHAEVSSGASVEDPGTRDTVLESIVEVTVDVQSDAESVSSVKGPISSRVLRASMRSLGTPGPVDVKYTSEEEVEQVVSEFFLDVADRLQSRSELASALLTRC